MLSDTDVLSAVALFLVNYFLHSTVFLVGAWMALFILRSHSHALREWIWKLAAVLPLMSALAAVISGNFDITSLIEYSVVSNQSALQEERQTTSRRSLDAVHGTLTGREHGIPTEKLAAKDGRTRLAQHGESAAADRDHERATDSVQRVGQIGVNAPTVSPNRVDTAQSRATSISSKLSGFVSSFLAIAANWFSLGWITWTACYLICFAIGIHRLSDKLRGRTVRNGKARRILDALLERNTVERPVTLRMSSEVDEPAAFGVFRWTIVIPADPTIERDSELKALLAHELAHLVRRDVLWLWAGRCLGGVFPFQLLNRLAFARWRSESEFLADRWAVQAGADARSLARCLTQIAETNLRCRTPQLAASARGGRSTIVSRVSELLGEFEPDLWMLPVRRFVITSAMAMLATTLVIVLQAFGMTIPVNTAVARNLNRLEQSQDVRVQAEDHLALTSRHEWEALQVELDQLANEVAFAAELANKNRAEDSMLSSLVKLRARSESLRDRAQSVSLRNKESD